MTYLGVEPEPIKNEWFTEKHAAGELKEIQGGTSIIHWHCQTPMKRVIRYQRTTDKVRRIGRNSWICQVCDRRRYPDSDLGM